MTFIIDDSFPSAPQTAAPRQCQSSDNGSGVEPLLGSSSVIDVKEDEQSILLSIDMPGVLGKDISVSVEDGVLNIRGFRCVKDTDGRVVKRQRLCHRFAVDTDLVEVDRAIANIWNGLLNLYAPKKTRPSTVNIPVTEIPDYCSFKAGRFGSTEEGPFLIPDDLPNAVH